LHIRGVLEGLLEIGRYHWKGVFKAYILHARIEGFGAFKKELCGVEQETNIFYYCKYTTFVGHGFCHIFGLEANFWPRFSRKVLSYVGNLHRKFREVWSYGSKVMKNFVHGC